MEQPSVYDHYAVDGDHGYPDGVYRVVGRKDGTVVLLRVGDCEGRRVHTGEVIEATTDEVGGFEVCGNPDGRKPLPDRVASLPETAYWTGRAFASGLVSNPAPAAVGVALVAAGYVGDGVMFAALAVAGGVVLAYAGGGR
jgi:hypothetical protein